MKRILLTGGSGFVGKNLREYIVREYGGIYREASRIILDTISTVTRSFQSLFFKLGETDYELCFPTSRELNVLDEESVCEWLGSVRFNVVLHFAVYTDAVDKNKDGSKILDYNLRSFMIFYKYRKLCGKLFYSGSGAEFDKNYDILQAREEMLSDPDEISGAVLNGSDAIQLVPTDPYGLMKYTAGRLIELSDNVYNVRIFGLFGKYEYKFRFITDMILRSLSSKPFEVRQNVYFDYLYIDDFCRMLMALIPKRNLKYHSYNLVSGERISLREICSMVNEAAVEYRESGIEELDRQIEALGESDDDGAADIIRTEGGSMDVRSADAGSTGVSTSDECTSDECASDGSAADGSSADIGSRREELEREKDALLRLTRQPVIFEKDGMNNEYTASADRILEELGDFTFTPMQQAIDELYAWHAQELVRNCKK